MTSWWFKSLVGLGVAVLVGCAVPPSSSVPVPLAAKAMHVPTPHGLPSDVQAKPVELPPLVKLTAMAVPSQPYTVPVQTYEPLVTDAPWKQRGRASWYGKSFDGRRTASGERFSATALTAAHRTLPIPSYARVRVVASGQEVIVRVNDRGPFHAARVLDLSFAAAQKLGIVEMGSAEVEIERLANQDLYEGSWRRGESGVVIP